LLLFVTNQRNKRHGWNILAGTVSTAPVSVLGNYQHTLCCKIIPWWWTAALACFVDPTIIIVRELENFKRDACDVTARSTILLQRESKRALLSLTSDDEQSSCSKRTLRKYFTLVSCEN